MLLRAALWPHPLVAWTGRRRRPPAKLRPAPQSPAPSLASPDDEPHGPVEEEVVPGPVDQHEHLAAEADDVDEVHRQPDEPPDEPGKVEPANLSDRGVAADRRHDAGVLVAKRVSSAMPHHLRDAGRDMLAGLHRDRNEHRQQILTVGWMWLDRGVEPGTREVADHEYDGMARHLQRPVDADPRLPRQGRACRAPNVGGP